MVDFNNEATVSTPASDIVRILILERRYNLMEAIERRILNDSMAIEAGQDLAVIKARLYSFYFEICEVIPRRMKIEEKEQLEKDIQANDFAAVMRAFRSLNSLLDTIKLTRIDTKKVYDPTLVEDENKEKGL